MSTLQNDKKPTISGGSTWDYTKRTQQGFHEGNQVGNKDGRHVFDEGGPKNEVLRDLAAARRRDRERKSKVEIEQGADQRGRTKCRPTRPNKVPVDETRQASGSRDEK